MTNDWNDEVMCGSADEVDLSKQLFWKRSFFTFKPYEVRAPCAPCGVAVCG